MYSYIAWNIIGIKRNRGVSVEYKSQQLSAVDNL